MCDNNGTYYYVDNAFRYYKKKLHQFEVNKEFNSTRVSSDVNISEFGNFQQQISVENYISKIEELSIFEEECSVNKLIKELSAIKPGKEHANIFHEYISKALNLIFEGYLLRQKTEVKTNDGRKRIDIMFDNLVERGFFHEIKSSYNVHYPIIIIECKNYLSTPSNPEIDQLIGRFNNHLGKFEILVCRKIEDRRVLINRCKDALNGGQGYIIVLSDVDIRELLILRRSCDDEGINNYLRDKFDELIL